MCVKGEVQAEGKVCVKQDMIMEGVVEVKKEGRGEKEELVVVGEESILQLLQT